MESIYWAVIGLSALVLLQVFLTVRVWRIDLYDRDQKVGQTQLIWFIPVIGSMLVGTMLWELRKEAGTGTR
jgi:hypothetical protein